MQTPTPEQASIFSDPDRLETSNEIVGDEQFLIVKRNGIAKAAFSKVASFVLSSFTIVLGSGLGAIARTLLERLSDQPISPKDYGAKGDGKANDSAAIQATVDAAFSRMVESALHNGTKSSGNVVIDFGGREYLLSSPITLPGDRGGVTFSNGYLTASNSFPIGEYLIADNNKGTSDQIDFHRITFNGSNRANCLKLSTFIRCGIDRCWFTGNYQYGLHLASIGFETMVSRSYFFQSLNGGTMPNTVGIYIENQCTDNHFTDLVINNNAVGIDSYSQANVYTNVHIYGSDHRQNKDFWAMRLMSNTSNNALNRCQFDEGCRLLIQNPSRSYVRGCTFSSLQPVMGPVDGIVLQSVTQGNWTQGLIITNNVFNVPLGSDVIKVGNRSLSFDPTQFKQNYVKDNAAAMSYSTAKAVAATSAGAVSNVSVLLGGTFTGTPSVTITDSTGTGATATAVMSNGVANIQVTDIGSGFTKAPTVTISGGGGIGAAAIALIINGVLQRIKVTSAGVDYTSEPTIIISGGDGHGATATASLFSFVKSVTVTAGGAGYVAPTVAISGGQAEPIVRSTQISIKSVAAVKSSGSVSLENHYLLGSVQKLLIGGRNTVPGAPITSVNLISGGSGYTSPPTVTITGGNGYGASAVANISEGSVESITLTNPGQNYTAVPKVTISGGSGTGAAAKIVLGTSVYSPANVFATTANNASIEWQAPGPVIGEIYVDIETSINS